jgi:hypothetical protein
MSFRRQAIAVAKTSAEAEKFVAAARYAADVQRCAGCQRISAVREFSVINF